MASICTEQLRFTAEKTLSRTCFPQFFSYNCLSHMLPFTRANATTLNTFFGKERQRWNSNTLFLGQSNKITINKPLLIESLSLIYTHMHTNTHTHENKSKSSDWKWRRLAYKNANLNSGFNAHVANTFLVGSFIGSPRGMTIQFYWRSEWWNYFTVFLPNSMNSSQDT